jgi:hypothetical protein
MHGGGNRAGDLQNYLVYQHASTDHASRNFFGRTQQMKLHMDVGRYVPDRGRWLVGGGNPREDIGGCHIQVVYASMYPNINSCAFILEFSQGCGCLTGAFLEQTISACSYRGELLGLRAIHLILLSANKIDPALTGLVHIHSDCLGALDKIQNLPLHYIPSKCQQSDVLKNVILHCSSLSFIHLFAHISAHQDDCTQLENLMHVQAKFVGSCYSQEGQYQLIDCGIPCRRIYEMMMMIRSTELVLIEIISVIFCYPCNSMCDAPHSKILFGKTQIFCFS